MIASTTQLNCQPNLECSIVLCGAIPVVLRDALRDSGLNVCFSSDLRLALQTAEHLEPAILMVDENEIQNIEPNVLRIALALMRSLRVVVLVSTLPESKRKELLRVGAAGFLDEEASPETTLYALAHVAAGEIWASRQLVSDTLREMVSVIDDPRFTRRETEVLRYVAAGDDNRHIAERLFISRETVRWHLRSAYAKLGIHNRHAAADLMRSVVPIRP